MWNEKKWSFRCADSLVERFACCQFLSIGSTKANPSVICQVDKCAKRRNGKKSVSQQRPMGHVSFPHKPICILHTIFVYWALGEINEQTWEAKFHHEHTLVCDISLDCLTNANFWPRRQRIHILHRNMASYVWTDRKSESKSKKDRKIESVGCMKCQSIARFSLLYGLFPCQSFRQDGCHMLMKIPFEWIKCVRICVRICVHVCVYVFPVLEVVRISHNIQ